MINSNSDYAVVSNAEAASIINRFTPDMIDDIMTDALGSKLRNYTTHLTNIVAAIDQNQRLAMLELPDKVNEIKQSTDELYLHIIQRICEAHNLTFIGTDSDNLYSTAYIFYDFFISQFSHYLYNFFSTYINREKNTLYEALELAGKKREIPNYSKKIYKNDNPKLANIHAHIGYVLDNICQYDIDMNTFIELACIPDRAKANFIIRSVVDNGDFYKNYVVSHFRQNYALITSSIRLELQGIASAEITDII